MTVYFIIPSEIIKDCFHTSRSNLEILRALQSKIGLRRRYRRAYCTVGVIVASDFLALTINCML